VTGAQPLRTSGGTPTVPPVCVALHGNTGSLNNAPGFPVDYERLLLENLGTVEQVVTYVARRHRLSRDEAEELSSAVKLKLVDRDYEVLRKYEGRSSLRTYLTAVVHRHFLDERIARWGKWRPSMQARRLGPVAVLLDRLLTRDGMSVEEASEVLRTNHGVVSSRNEVDALAKQLPSRVTRRFLGEEALAAFATADPQQDTALQDTQQIPEADRIEQALAAALDQLPADERLMLKLQFHDGHRVSTISRLLGLDQKALYRKIERIKLVLRLALEARGVTREQVTAILGHSAVDFAPVVNTAADGNPPPGPSL
jgi:RNA polymerase sigma factor (sigma-70 family)